MAQSNTQYKSTILVSNSFDLNQLRKLRIGQWVRNELNQRGQFLGITDSETIVIRWQNQRFEKRDAINNKHLRRFAKIYGSK